MYRLIDWYEQTRDFLETGGPVMVLIVLVTMLMWILIFERVFYFRIGHRQLVSQVMNHWRQRAERSSWNARTIRDAMVSRVALAVEANLPLIKTLVALCPLLGLLGTVTGMVEVFEVMAFSGSGNPRSMAAGVSKATIPTMAGMVAALSGVLAATFLSRFATREVEHLRAEMSTED